MACIASLEGTFHRPIGPSAEVLPSCFFTSTGAARTSTSFCETRRYLTALSPRLNDHTEALTRANVEQSNFLKLIFDGGEFRRRPLNAMTLRRSVLS